MSPKIVYRQNNGRLYKNKNPPSLKLRRGEAKTKIKMTHTSTLKTSGFNLNHIGWKYYNDIKKKAMEQEFSWAGLALSLSIAFFVVFSTAVILNLVNKSFEQTRGVGVKAIYRLEAKSEYLQGGLRNISSSPFFGYGISLS